jgi:asparagine synthase (glutamine-hydrolysing)
MKLRKGRGKCLMRTLLHRHVPAQLTDRPKMGFTVPVEAWMNTSLRDWVEDHLNSRQLSSVRAEHIPVNEAPSGLHKIPTRRTPYQRWGLAVLGAWMEGQKSTI